MTTPDWWRKMVMASERVTSGGSAPLQPGAGTLSGP